MIRYLSGLRPLFMGLAGCALVAGTLIVGLSATCLPAYADEGDAGALRVPRFVSLNASEINVRTGPGPQYPIAWKYVKAGLPVEIVAEYEYWRKIRDHDGSVGWVHKSLLSGRRSAYVADRTRTLYSDPDLGSRPLAKLEADVIVKIRKCKANWCSVEVNDFSGWIPGPELWGVYPNENVE